MIFIFDLWQILAFIPVGILAGIVSSTVGMASLVSYPALLYIGGLPAIFANVTNSSAIIFGGLGSSLSSLPELKGHWKQAIRTLILTFFGSIIGSSLLLLQPSSSFSKIVPFFILFASYTILKPQKNNPQTSTNKRISKGAKFGAALAILLMGAYMGYFGAAAGVIMIAILSRTTNEEYPVYNAIRNVAALSANVVAMVIYAFKSNVYWVLVIPLGIGLFIGGYIGPKIVRRVPERILKWIVGILAIVLALVLFKDAYF